tara:strand:+ start:656 stop:1138 length:483 start_codon:yes stop_codon:yes gene_type:complete
LKEKLNFTRHLIECHCILKIFQNKTKPLYHKFSVFSLIDEEDNIEKKYVSCNNCSAIHEIKDVCKSEIKWGSDIYSGLVITKDDIKFNLESKNYNNVIEILETNDCDISTWELVEHCLENNIDYTIVLNKQDIQDNTVYNCLNIEKGSVKIKKEISQRYV